MRNTLFVFTLLFMSGCSHTAIHDRPFEIIHKYNSLLQSEMVQAFGKPDYEESFPLSKARDEMRGPLQKHFPKKFRNSQNIIIKELEWQDGDFYLTSWFKMRGNDWVVFESLRWHKDVRF